MAPNWLIAEAPRLVGSAISARSVGWKQFEQSVFRFKQPSLQQAETFDGRSRQRGYEGRVATLEIAASRDATGQSYEWRRVMKPPCRLLAAAALAVGATAFAAPADAAVTTPYGNGLSAQAVATPQRASLRNPRGRQEQETIRFRETAAASPFSPWGIGLILGIGF